jgi:hypothetical protein
MIKDAWRVNVLRLGAKEGADGSDVPPLQSDTLPAQKKDIDTRLAIL